MSPKTVPPHWDVGLHPVDVSKPPHWRSLRAVKSGEIHRQSLLRHDLANRDYNDDERQDQHSWAPEILGCPLHTKPSAFRLRDCICQIFQDVVLECGCVPHDVRQSRPNPAALTCRSATYIRSRQSGRARRSLEFGTYRSFAARGSECRHPHVRERGAGRSLLCNLFRQFTADQAALRTSAL